MRGKVLVFLTSLFGLVTCQPSQPEEHSDPIIAQVDSKNLYASEIEKLIHDGISTYDSNGIANAYIDRWIKDELLIREAQKYYSSDAEIESLVEDYKNQMIKYKHEKQVLEEKLDTAVNETVLAKFYEKNKANYVLEEPLYKILYAAVPENKRQIDRLYNSWINNDYAFMKEYCSSNSVISFLDKESWISGAKLSAIVPDVLIKNKTLSNRTTIQKNMDHIEYFFKVLDVRQKDDHIPIELITDKLKRLILHERKQEVIHDYKQNLYEKAMRQKIVKLQIN